MQKLPVSQRHFTEGFSLILFSLALESSRGTQTHNEKKKEATPHPHPRSVFYFTYDHSRA